VIQAFWQLYWEQGVNISKPEGMIQACRLAGYSPEEAAMLVNEKAQGINPLAILPQD